MVTQQTMVLLTITKKRRNTMTKENIPNTCRTIQEDMIFYGAKNPPIHVRPDGAMTTDFLTIGRWGNIRNENIVAYFI